MEVGILPTELCWLLFVKPSLKLCFATNVKDYKVIGSKKHAFIIFIWVVNRKDRWGLRAGVAPLPALILNV
ncbi:hypothetical protein CUMW_117290 [Citrus unshiu]|nr:hypothetical protein CUMW_117290 [Citrus unshiu]